VSLNRTKIGLKSLWQGTAGNAVIRLNRTKIGLK